MADSPINLFGTQKTTIPIGSFFGFDWWNGSAFETVKILSEDLKTALGVENMATANLTLTGNRSHDAASFRFTLGKAKDITLESFISPTLGIASINLNGYGNLVSEVTHRFNASGLAVAEMYGNRTTRFFGGIGVNIPPQSGYGVYSDDTIVGVFGSSTNGKGGVFNSVNSTAIEGGSVNFRGGVFNGYDYGAIGVGNGPNGFGLYGYSNGAGGWGVFSYQNPGSAGALISNGNTLVESVLTGAMAASAVFQVNSSTKGAISAPKMSTASKNAITSLTSGLQVYDTDMNRLEYFNGSYWQAPTRLAFVQATQSSLTASTTTYFGNIPQAPTATPAIRKIIVRKHGVIRFAEIYSRSGTAGTNEAWSMYIRVNNTTDYLIATVSAATQERIWSNPTMNIPLAPGDYFEIKTDNPAWGTAPTNTAFGGNVGIE